jgi:hypothetical protein
MYSIVTSARWKNKYLIVRKGLGALSHVVAETTSEDYATQIAAALARYNAAEQEPPVPVVMRRTAGDKR